MSYVGGSRTRGYQPADDARDAARDRLGSALATAAIATGANAILPGSGAFVGAGLSLFHLFGASDEDKRRAARVQYFYDLAAAGNVGAAQVMLGALSDVSNNEKTYWQHALDQLSSSNPAVWNAAQDAGDVRFTGTGDTPENYPHMQAYARQWAAENAPIGGSSSSSRGATSAAGGYFPGPTTNGGSSSSSRAQTLPLMTTRAPYNWTPVVAGVLGTAGIAALLLSRRRR